MGIVESSYGRHIVAVVVAPENHNPIQSESSVQEEHDGALLEVVSLFCDKLLAKTPLDHGLPDLTPRLDNYVPQRKY